MGFSTFDCAILSDSLLKLIPILVQIVGWPRFATTSPMGTSVGRSIMRVMLLLMGGLSSNMHVPYHWKAMLLALVWACAPSVPTTTDNTSTEPPDRDRSCEIEPALGDVVAVPMPLGEIMIVGGNLHVLKSTDGAHSFVREDGPIECWWPGGAFVGESLLISCAERKAPHRLLILSRQPDGNWAAPKEVDSSSELLIDTGLQPLRNQEILLLATHVDFPSDFDRAVYTIRTYRSFDGGVTWKREKNAKTGPRGVHLEDPRTVVLPDGDLLMAWEREEREGGRSSILQMRSNDGGRTWMSPQVLWSGGGDTEPGGYLLFPDGELWFIASSDEIAGGGSYARAIIMVRSSIDGGRTWSKPRVLVGSEDQISFGGILLPDGDVLLPSLRHYSRARERSLALYVVESGVGDGYRCAVQDIFSDDFERGSANQWCSSGGDPFSP